MIITSTGRGKYKVRIAADTCREQRFCDVAELFPMINSSKAAAGNELREEIVVAQWTSSQNVYSGEVLMLGVALCCCWWWRLCFNGCEGERDTN